MIASSESFLMTRVEPGKVAVQSGKVSTCFAWWTLTTNSADGSTHNNNTVILHGKGRLGTLPSRNARFLTKFRSTAVTMIASAGSGSTLPRWRILANGGVKLSNTSSWAAEDPGR